VSGEIDPDLWDEDTWTARIASVCDAHPEVNPMLLVEMVNADDVSIDAEGRIIPRSERAIMIAEVWDEINRMTEDK